MIDTFIKIKKAYMRRGFNVWGFISQKIQERYRIDINDADRYGIDNTKVIKLDEDSLHDYARTHKYEPGVYEYYHVIIAFKEGRRHD